MVSICTAIVAAAMLIVWPFAELPYGDDTAYTYISLNLARSGHLAYNGWETAVLVLHAYWGALFIRLFGFSFECVRFSTLPFALGAVGFCYLLVRRAGLQAPTAAFVTLLFGLSPLFLPVAVSFMTDAPGLFFMFASLYLLSLAAQESASRRGYGWLLLGSALGFLGGTGRQIVWLAPLVVLPYLAWIRRRQTAFALVSLTAWISVLGGMTGVMAWFNRQPYAIPQPSVLGELKRSAGNPLPEVNAAARLLLMLLLICLPAALPLVLRGLIDLGHGGDRGRKILVAVLLLGVVGAVFIHPSLASIPWVSSTLNWEGINGAAPLPGRPIVLTTPIRALVAMIVYTLACVLAGELTNLRDLARNALRPFVNPSASEFTLAAMSLVSFVYFGLVVLRDRDFDVFDRYLLPILPWAATVLLLALGSGERARQILKSAMPVSWAALAVLALYSVLNTQDYWALARARVSATKRLEAAGVPRTSIDAGFEYNAWTELLLNGRLNSRWVLNPPGAYRPGLSQTPSVVPLYRLEYKPASDTTASELELGSIPYFSFLPPFHKQVSVDRVLAQ
jgi:hypothetical protein